MSKGTATLGSLRLRLKLYFFCSIGFGALLFCLFCAYAWWTTSINSIEQLGEEERTALEKMYASIENKLPLTHSAFAVRFPEQLYAKSGIIIDASNGTILYEKNADEQIPPASMTKLVVMHIVFQEINAGNVALSDIVPLPPESWWINAPPQSSLMFLGEGQKVTLEELLLGLAISSGNDAAVAVAHYISGSVPAFIDRMNVEMQSLGLTKTHFADTSGYSAHNTSTAREFAQFSKVYIERYPDSLQLFHSAKKISYPLPHNMPEGQKNINAPYVQEATNKLLGVLEGADGLKTGFIDESGFNLSLTAQRDGTRFISVTMGGPGNGSIEGNKFRSIDGTNLMEWAFANFYTFSLNTETRVPVHVWQGKQNALNAIEFSDESFTLLRQDSTKEKRITRTVEVEENLVAPIKRGTLIGSAIYKSDNIIIKRVPLIADRSIDQASSFKQNLDQAVQWILNQHTSK